MENLQILIQTRQKLHRLAELSGNEVKTAYFIADELRALKPSLLLTGIGGNGVLAVFDSKKPGPTILFRADLDALPIPESIELSYASNSANEAHKCGHDGHMAILLGLCQKLSIAPLKRGRIVALFQPAEETGQGASFVLRDAKFSKSIKAVDYAFALHNLPGYELGQVILKDGIFASASVGLKVQLTGQSSHAAEPHLGINPALAISQLIESFSSSPQFHTDMTEPAKVTVIHARLGSEAFGTSPGEGVVMATLRAQGVDVLDRIKQRCLQIVEGIARAHRLKVQIEWVEEFPVVINHHEPTEIVRAAVRSLVLESQEMEHPFAWSEDFGHYSNSFKSCLFGLGAGIDHPALHNPNYDFPDDLIVTGTNLLIEIVKHALNYSGHH
ncbi:amidohydrolase [Calditrichota bacterium]